MYILHALYSVNKLVCLNKYNMHTLCDFVVFYTYCTNSAQFKIYI